MEFRSRTQSFSIQQWDLSHRLEIWVQHALSTPPFCSVTAPCLWPGDSPTRRPAASRVPKYSILRATSSRLRVLWEPGASFTRQHDLTPAWCSSQEDSPL